MWVVTEGQPFLPAVFKRELSARGRTVPFPREGARRAERRTRASLSTQTRSHLGIRQERKEEREREGPFLPFRMRMHNNATRAKYVHVHVHARKDDNGRITLFHFRNPPSNNSRPGKRPSPSPLSAFVAIVAAFITRK